MDVSNITESIKGINSAIEELRNTNQDTDVDYSMIELLAKQISFGKHPLNKQRNKRASQVYLEMLLNIVRLNYDTEKNVNRLVFIQWLLIQSGIDLSLELLFTNCYKMTTDSYYEMVDIIPSNNRNVFIVDAMIAANISGTTNQEVLEYIAGMSAVLGIPKEKLRTLSVLACAILRQGFDGISETDFDNVLTEAKSYKFYFLDSDMISDSIRGLRNIVVDIIDSNVWDFKWKVKQM